MTTEWVVDVPAERCVLDAQNRGEIVFTVTNVGLAASQAVLDMVPGDGADRSWFTVQEPRRFLPAGASDAYLVGVAPPPGTVAGTYSVQARVYSADADVAPEESSRQSKRVQFEVPETKKPPRPWWPYAVAAALVVVVLLTVGWLMFGRGGGGSPPAGGPPSSAAPVTPAASASSPGSTTPSTSTTPPTSTTPVLVPDVRGEMGDDALKALRTAGFVVKVESVVDTTCNNIGRVIRQTPKGGTTLLPGQTVTIVVGERPGNPCN